MYVCVNTYGDGKKESRGWGELRYDDDDDDDENGWKRTSFGFWFCGRRMNDVSVKGRVRVERNDISKQNNQTLTLVRTLATKASIFSQQLTSPTCLSFQPSTQSRSKRQFQSTPLHLNFFFFFFLGGDFLLEKK